MTSNDEQLALAILREVGAILTGDHFIYTSGRHGSAYVNKDMVSLHPPKLSRLAREIANHFRRSNIEMVVGPALGGITLSFKVAEHFSAMKGEEILACYTEEDKGEKVFRRGFGNFVSGKRVLVVEDITTTGASAKKTVEAARNAGGEVVGVGLLCNRNPGKVTAEFLGVPELYTLTVIPLESWSAEECSLCQQGLPVNTEIGKGREWLAKQRQQS